MTKQLETLIYELTITSTDKRLHRWANELLNIEYLVEYVIRCEHGTNLLIDLPCTEFDKNNLTACESEKNYLESI
jgi:hypothetical protein|tara:strand:+ start:819 stop:1043 length:225 start_codon:yes stop_codon:yes gene_type:complete